VSSGDPTVDTQNATLLNVSLPEALEGLAKDFGVKVLQVATDCVFSGLRGGYSESDSMDARDTYGMSKVEGELKQPSAMRIRCSIVGPDDHSTSGLLAWFLSQAQQEAVVGFADHSWNGVTTSALSKLFLGIYRSGSFEPGCFHWVPRGTASKYQLLSWFREGLRLQFPVVRSGLGPSRIDRTLITNRPEVNEELWTLAGYPEAPTVKSLIAELTEELLSEHGRGI
jgi:dTDP-4-dehydrorhamnose reductase